MPEYDIMKNLIAENKDIFHLKEEKLTDVKGVYHKIKTIDENPIYVKQFFIPCGERAEIEKQTQEMLDQGILEHSDSPYNFPIFLIPKREGLEGKTGKRLVIDLRLLNKRVLDQEFPIPQITELLDQLKGAKYFSCLDLYAGFYQVLLDPADKHKAAFSTHNAHYQFRKLPMGLKSSPKSYQRLLTRLLKNDPNIKVYIDDLLIFSKTLEELFQAFIHLMIILRDDNLKIHIKNVHF